MLTTTLVSPLITLIFWDSELVSLKRNISKEKEEKKVFNKEEAQELKSLKEKEKTLRKKKPQLLKVKLLKVNNNKLLKRLKDKKVKTEEEMMAPEEAEVDTRVVKIEVKTEVTDPRRRYFEEIRVLGSRNPLRSV